MKASAFDLHPGATAWVSCLLLALAAGSGLLAALRSPELRARYTRHAEQLEVELRYQCWSLTGARLAAVQLAVVAIACTAAALCAHPLPLLGAALAWFAPGIVLSSRRRRRTEQIEAQLIGFLIALSHALRAGPALGDALNSSAEVVDAPLSDELHLMLREHALGSPLDRALDTMNARVQSPVVGAALSTLRIARLTGGDFVRTLERTAATLREMARLEGVIRTKTAEGRAQTVVVSALPFPMLLAIDSLSPGLLDPLWTTNTGHVLIAISVVFWIAAILAARRIVHVDI